MDQLVPVLEEFVKTYSGQINKDFWNNIFCDDYARNGSGSVITISGWILAIFPYDKNDKKLLKNHYSKLKVSVEDIPNYAAKVPFQLVLNDNTSHAMEFIAGFANVLNENGMFRPQLTAAIASNDYEQMKILLQMASNGMPC